MKVELRVLIEGEDEADLCDALKEVKRMIDKGLLAGFSETETSKLHFHMTCTGEKNV